MLPDQLLGEGHLTPHILLKFRPSSRKSLEEFPFLETNCTVLISTDPAKLVTNPHRQVLVGLRCARNGCR